MQFIRSTPPRFGTGSTGPTGDLHTTFSIRRIDVDFDISFTSPPSGLLWRPTLFVSQHANLDDNDNNKN